MRNALKAVLLIACLGFGLSAWSQSATALDTQNFTVSNFTADFYLDRNSANTSSLHTVETITAIFPSYDQNHGILRSIPDTYQGHTTSFRLDSVTDENNNPIAYSVSHQNNNSVLKIGVATTYVHGPKTYKISYDQKNVVSIQSDHDEFYWDVNGDQWQQPFAQVTANLHIPAGLAGELQARTACYVGLAGSTDSTRCSTAKQTAGGGEILTTQATSLGTGENLTIVSAFNQGAFSLGPEIAQAKHSQLVKDFTIGVATVAPALLSGIFLFTLWWRFGRDPKGKGIIIPEYQPYKGLNVLTSDYVLQEKLNTKAISALIVELAVKKYLTISETVEHKRLAKDKTNYSLKLIMDPAALSVEEKLVLGMFFKAGLTVGSTVNLLDLKSSLGGDVKTFKKLLGSSLAAAGLFRSNPETVATKYYTWAGVLLFAGFFLIQVHVSVSVFIGLSLLLAAAAFAIFARYMPSRTNQGVLMRDHVLGLKEYIKLAEADRLKFLQSPQGAEKIQETGLNPNELTFKVKLFESLLPYAMVFGLEKDWAKQFQDIYNNPPDWYAGNWNTFNAFYLASSLDNFTKFNSVNFTPPSSSGGSGFGGGFSGGGGGGGGGGGW